MCGILGIISQNNDININNLESIKNVLNHRGPDASNYFIQKNIFLLHNRLSIIDLDERSNQPLFNNQKNLCIVFNGEIYNYLELKQLLISKYSFQTKSDTEVLLAAYQIWGEKMLDKIKGAFAFCIYDLKKKLIFFARDRFGQKPFYFHKTRSSLFFSSEIKGLIALGYKPKPNYLSWKNYLTNASTDDQRDTFFKEIFQLKPGEKAIYQNGNLNIERWYHISNYINNEAKEINIKDKLLKLLTRSIDLNSKADVPLAISLSGGIDSTFLMSLCYKNNILKYKPKCYSVHFDEYTEKNEIDISTKKYNFKTNYINFSKTDLLNIFEPITWSLESPSGGLMNCGLAKLSYIASKDNFKIILDGTGLDEGFGGYEVHHLQYLNSLKNNNSPLFENNLKMFCLNWGIDKTKVLKKISHLSNIKAKTIDGYDLTNELILSDNLKSLKHSSNINKKEFNKIDDDIKNSLIEYIQHSKIPRNNRLKDRISMAHSVELRLPFLEHDLLEFALSLNTKSYFLNGKSKSVLRYAAKDYIDPRVRFKKNYLFSRLKTVG